MPWAAGDATRHQKKATTDKLKRQWAKIANSALKRCLDKDGKKDKCEASAIRQANSVIAKQVQENEMDNSEWTMASVAQTAIEVGLAVARETDEIANDEAAKTLDLLRSKWGELDETAAPIVSIADVDVDGERVSLTDIVEFYRVGKAAEKEEEVEETNSGVPVLEQAYADARQAIERIGAIMELDVSVDDYNSNVRGAFYKRFGNASDIPATESEPYVRDVFVDHPDLGNTVIANWAEKYYAVDYKTTDDGIEFANKSDWREAVRVYKVAETEEQEPYTESKDNGTEVTIEADEPVVEEPLIEFDEGVAQIGELEEQGHALAIIEEGDGTMAAPLKMHIEVIRPGMGNAKMKRYYSAQMLQENAHKFKGAKMYPVNHSAKDKSVGNEVSQVLDCPVGFTERGGPIALVGVFDEAFARNVRNRAALGALGSLECSVIGTGQMRKGKVNGNVAYIVEDIDDGPGLDWVTKAGAGGRALEIVENEEEGGSIMTEEQVEEVVEEPVVADQVTETEVEETEPQQDVVEIEGEVLEEAMIAEAVVAEEVDKTSLPEAFKAALKVREYADADELAGAITKATDDFKAATGSGKPFGQGQTKKETEVAEGDEAPMERKSKRLDQILADAGYSISA